ncbi:Ribosome-releasing factor 2, mitochondrial [Malassezia psittaci]|uniref:Elongation factor 2 n=1 Tax=Malassezia psittaci TaxID=1821823 RepID=A0AAF0JF76_9BASI|nr:Ribosome-releasing factor 2, mitochondrial [Malassezia psittaci]
MRLAQGIVAHIDAGKTTLTERILHLTNSLTLPGLKPPELQAQSTAPGDVDTGSTVTDFLEEERQRGITIQSAAVGPVWWKRSQKDSLPSVAAITLVDTPGHVDFGIEVERTVRVVDGTVVVLDAVEGVEPQSANVWNQTMRYGVRAHLFFINKMDREGASIAKSLRSIIDRGLHSKPVLLQLPAYASQIGMQTNSTQGIQEDPIVGVVDLLSKTLIRFEGVSGHKLEFAPLDPQEHGELYNEVCKAREALVEIVSTLDIELLGQVLELDDSSQDTIPIDAVHKALRRLTLAGEIAPVLCGAAARNIGVQPLLDAIALYLPSPEDRPEVEGRILPGTNNERTTTIALSSPEPTALAFKVVYDKRRGPVTFVRVYSGAIRTASTMFNTTTQNKERITRLMLPYADQFVEVPSLQAGQIGVVLGLRDTRTGDTLIDARHSNRKQTSRDEMRTLRLRRVHVPPPVFSVSVEPRSKAEEGAVTEALQMLVRTDPSLHVNEGSASLASGASQTVLSGMGELHLEIAKHRLRDEFQVDAHLGQVRVGYRETLDNSTKQHGAQHTELLEHNINGKRAKAGMTLHVQGTSHDHADENLVVVDLGDEPDHLYDTLPLSKILEQGAAAALARGPLSGFPLQGLHITMSNIQTFGPDVSTPAALRMLVAVCLRKLLSPSQDSHTGRTVMMEPMMRVSIEANEMYAGKLSTDITVEQHGSIVELVRDANVVQEAQGEYQVYIPPHNEEESSHKSQGNTMLIVANIPLARMTRYSTRLRALTGGAGVYQMELEGFSTVTLERQKELLQELGRAPRP